MLKEAFTLTEIVDYRRLEANKKLDPKVKSTHGQFMTPQPVAQFMASLFGEQEIGEIRLLDAGAGVGSLTAAFVKEFCGRRNFIKRIAATAYEIDLLLASYLKQTFADCERVASQSGIEFESGLFTEDFLEAGADQTFMGMEPPTRFTHAILNPPYKKIGSDSTHRKLLRSLGIETVNLYAGFLAVAIQFLEEGGELVAIVPRSFCNGPYFKPFRQYLIREMAICHIHVFESRTHTFKDDEVLQENIILHAIKRRQQGQVTLSSSEGVDFAHAKSRIVDFDRMVHPSDPEAFIHITVSEDDQHYVERMKTLPCTLEDLGIEVSTGPIVDFRLKEYLNGTPEPDTFPLIYPAHCKNHSVIWPASAGKKPNAIRDAAPVQRWLYPNGYYVLVRRFSSKEERRRVVASVHDPLKVPGEKIGFENHINVFHRRRQGLPPELARGLAMYLNSTIFDVCFRQFNGHTQVNVRDLYNIRYPDLATLEILGKSIPQDFFLTQEKIDTKIEKELFG